ncbi:hypothetical protein ACNKHS_02140 [Shigella flexneri]
MVYPQGFSRFPPARLEQFAVDNRITARSGLRSGLLPDFPGPLCAREAEQDKVYYHHAVGHDIILQEWMNR